MFVPEVFFDMLSQLLVENKRARDGMERGVEMTKQYSEKEMQLGMLRAQRDTIEHLFSMALKHNIKLQRGEK